ncbi:MAG: AmmeMemoRadiSam system protein B [Treponema sp.]|jgi:AmmeMemoRadiSam system protein B|nr:AmmeMemoRadiSam system protein B [Treponema sp.]
MYERGFSGSGRGRSPIGAGLFYPDNGIAIERRLESFGLKNGTGGNALAIISPHGAWDLSGAIAGAVFGAAAGRTKGNFPETAVQTVVLLGGIRESGVTGLFLSESDYFETPLGELPVDWELGSELASCDTFFVINDIPHLGEPTIEVQLPFVKYCFPEASIVPVLMGSKSGTSRLALILGLARALKIVFESRLDSTLFVVSANVSIYGNTNYGDEKTALSEAEACVRMLTEKRTEDFLQAVNRGEINSCGSPSAAALLESGLLENRQGKLIPGSLIKTRGEDSKTVYYSGIFFD